MTFVPLQEKLKVTALYVYAESRTVIILVNNQPDALLQCIYLFISLLYMFRATFPCLV